MTSNREAGATAYYDFVVIGSGFGGSVSAMRLTEKGYRVLVLERGKRYQAKDFPRSNWNIFKYLWLPAARCFGIMGINFFDDMMVLNGSGVGGGSLVYASTHIKPGRAFFEAEEWRGLADWEAELAPHYETANRMLGVTPNPRFWTADHVLRDLAREMGREETFEATPVAIFFGEPGQTVADPFFDGAGPPRAGCIHCGGCMVGCRHNAKNTLDKNYLYFAEQGGAIVRPEANVVDIRPLPAGQHDGARYEIVYEQITAWVRKPRYTVRAANVVVAAGVLGTVRLLLGCRDETQSLPQLSPRLGHAVRSNSESLMGVTARDSREDFSAGVAITSHFWIDDVTSVEPVRYPRGSSLLRNLALPLINLDGGFWPRLGRTIGFMLRHPLDFLKARVLPGWANNSTILLIMQTVENRMRMQLGRSIWSGWRQGLVTRQDLQQPIPAVIEAGRAVVQAFAERVDGIPQTTVNEVLLGTPSTAHILGGCGIGASPEEGVVDEEQQVFNYPGLYVVDGSVIPANLGVNPSLTITAMAERAMSKIPTAEPWEQRLAALPPADDAVVRLPAPAAARAGVLAATAAAITTLLLLLLRARRRAVPVAAP